MSEIMYQLVVQKGPNPGQVFPLSSTSISIGRDPTSDITLADPEVSRYHAQLVRTESGDYQLQDMGSTNGTFVSGKRLAGEPAPLAPGETIMFGSDVMLTYQAVGAEEDAMATMVEVSTRPLSETDPADVELTSEPPQLPTIEDMPEKASIHGYKPSVKAPPPPPPARPLVTPVEADVSRKKRRRRNTIIASVALLLLCCCCAIALSGYYVWGDPLVNWLSSQGLLSF